LPSIVRAVDHSTHRAATDDDIVQRQRALAATGGQRQRRVEQRACLFHVTPVEHRGQRAFHIGERDVGQESEAALIDADQRHIERREPASDRQHRAVATDSDRKLGVASELFRRRGGVAGQRRALRGLRIEDDIVTAVRQKRRQALERLGDAGARVAADQRDCCEALCRTPHGSD